MRITSAVLTAAIVVAAAAAARAALPAYIDVQSGIIIGRGEARLRSGDDYQAVRGEAVRNAKKNIYKVLERQPVDPSSMQQRTVGEYLRENPDKQNILDSFIESAEVVNESKDQDSILRVTIMLKVDGPDGFKVMLARLMGRVVAARTTSDTAAGEPGGEPGRLTGKPTAAGIPRVGQPYRIALLDFDNKSTYKSLDLGKIFTDRLLDRFRRDRRFDFLDNAEIKKTLDTNRLTAKKLWDAEVNESLRLDEVDGVILGAVTRYQSGAVKQGIGGTGALEVSIEMEIELKALDARSGRWVYFDAVPVSLGDRTFTVKSADEADRFIKPENLDSEDGLAARAFDAAVSKIEGIIRTLFPLEGYVLKTSGEKIYLNLTRADGLRNGDVLIVYRIGDMLTDPVTGKELGRIRDRIGSLRVTEAGETYSLAVPDEAPMEPVNPGDLVVIAAE